MSCTDLLWWIGLGLAELVGVATVALLVWWDWATTRKEKRHNGRLR